MGKHVVVLGSGTAGTLTANRLRSRPRQLHDGIEYRRVRIDRVDLDADTVHVAGGGRLTYDVLVVATGAALLPGETERRQRG